MTSPPARLASALLALSVVTVGGGCSFGQNGIAPPANRVFLPAGIAADPQAGLVYVVNSNSDLRFNAGTLAVVDVASAMKKRAAVLASAVDLCPKTRFSRTEDVPDDYCCRDLVDSNILNCNEPQFVQSDATVAIGSFGGAVALQSYRRDVNDPNSDLVRRLFIAVRAEPSITYADITVAQSSANAVDGGSASTAVARVRCTGAHDSTATDQGSEPFCDDNWKIRRPGGATPGQLVLPEEPHVLSLDDEHGILFVGHLTVAANGVIQGGGVSTLDVCDAARDPVAKDPLVQFAGLARTAFLPSALSQAVATLSPPPKNPADTDPLVYASARSSTAVSGMVLRDASQATCSRATVAARTTSSTGSIAARDLTLVPGESTFASAFLPHGADIRGILFSSTGDRAFVLHRNDSDSSANPAALVLVDRTQQADGTYADSLADTPVDILQVCGGPTGMMWHDPGSGRPLIFITCYDDGQVQIVDPDAFAILATMDVGAGPTSLIFSPTDPGIAYVASYPNSHLSVIDFKPGSRTENRVLMRIGLPHPYGE